MTHEEIKQNLLEADNIIKMLKDIERIRLRPLIDTIHRYTHFNDHDEKCINYEDGNCEDIMYYTLLAKQLKAINSEARFIEGTTERSMAALSEISEFVSNYNANSFYDKLKNDDDKAPCLPDE